MDVYVSLPSGKSCCVAQVSPESSVRALKAEAQRQLERHFLSLAFEGRKLDLSCASLASGPFDLLIGPPVVPFLTPCFGGGFPY